MSHCLFCRSSDSDGAFETPESTTPVKSVSPPLPPTEHPYTSSETLSPKHTGMFIVYISIPSQISPQFVYLALAGLTLSSDCKKHVLILGLF